MACPQAAQRSLTAATARYAALRGALSLLGPLMWGWLAVDLALKAIGTDYARVVRAVFLMSQVGGGVGVGRGEGMGGGGGRGVLWMGTGMCQRACDVGGARRVFQEPGGCVGEGV